MQSREKARKPTKDFCAAVSVTCASVSSMARRIVAENAREALVSALIKEEKSTPALDAEPASSEAEFKRKRKELLRAAGRAAVEESLHSGKRKASEMSEAGIVAQWNAYAEVYGTNGMAGAGADKGSSSKAAGTAADGDASPASSDGDSGGPADEAEEEGADAAPQDAAASDLPETKEPEPALAPPPASFWDF